MVRYAAAKETGIPKKRAHGIRARRDALGKIESNCWTQFSFLTMPCIGKTQKQVTNAICNRKLGRFFQPLVIIPLNHLDNWAMKWEAYRMLPPILQWSPLVHATPAPVKCTVFHTFAIFSFNFGASRRGCLLSPFPVPVPRPGPIRKPSRLSVSHAASSGCLPGPCSRLWSCPGQSFESLSSRL